MGLSLAEYQEAVQARRDLTVGQIPSAVAQGVKSLADAGWDGNYVVPNQLSSRSLDGPLILLNNWFGWEDLDALGLDTRRALAVSGYLQGIPTNRWLDRALEILGLTRADVYITQASVFLPRTAMNDPLPPDCYSQSVRKVLLKELGGRTPVALGSAAQRACATHGIAFVGTQHPSYQGGERRAQEIADAIRRVF